MMTPKPARPKLGQESVWDYPRPPRLERVQKRLRVVFNGITIADTQSGLRLLETSHPPVYYFPPSDTRMDYLRSIDGGSFCEWKGLARYFDVEVDGERARRGAWCYPRPTFRFADIGNHIAFYCHLMDGCFVGVEQARPQPGNFYGGWITDAIAGPFNGEPHTAGW